MTWIPQGQPHEVLVRNIGQRPPINGHNKVSLHHEPERRPVRLDPLHLDIPRTQERNNQGMTRKPCGLHLHLTHCTTMPPLCASVALNVSPSPVRVIRGTLRPSLNSRSSCMPSSSLELSPLNCPDTRLYSRTSLPAKGKPRY